MSALKKGMTIKIKDLKNNNWRNGRVGIIQGEYTDKKGFVRWKVKIIGKDGKSENYLGLKPENIEIIREGEVWDWLEPDEPDDRPETPPSAPQSPKNTTKGGRTRKKIRKRKKRKSRRKKRKQKKKKKSFRRK
jgi:hypothetical protein